MERVSTAQPEPVDPVDVELEQLLALSNASRVCDIGTRF